MVQTEHFTLEDGVCVLFLFDLWTGMGRQTRAIQPTGVVLNGSALQHFLVRVYPRYVSFTSTIAAL